MKKTVLVVLAAVVAVLLAAQTFAQDATPQPPQEAEVQAATETTQAVTATAGVTPAVAVTGAERAPAEPLVITDTVLPAYITLNLEAGFPLDPFLVSVNGGGPYDASGLGPGCVGYVNNDPTVTLDWEGETEFVETFFYSDHDPVLIVQTPSGEFLCNDDANDVLLDPVVEIANPPQGRYNIWVGSFDRDQLLPGLLVITTNKAVNIGTFRPGDLIKRASIPEDVVEPGELSETAMPTVTAALEAFGGPVLEPGFAPINVPVVVTGTVPAFDLPIRGVVCNGYINENVDYAFTVSGPAAHLRVYFEGNDDASLLVVGPGGAVYCNDDSTIGANLHPMLDIPNPPAGGYLVLVGRLDQEAPLEGQLTLVESTEQAPSVLAPGE
jgi:hypothetical protein